jgi:hypothetical protein
MAMDICNASQSFDIEGAQEKYNVLKLEDFPGEDVTSCAATAKNTASFFKADTHLITAPVQSFSRN